MLVNQSAPQRLNYPHFDDLSSGHTLGLLISSSRHTGKLSPIDLSFPPIAQPSSCRAKAGGVYSQL